MAGILPTIIDVSEHQGNINWDQVRPNIHFAIVRVQDGTWLDRRLIENIAAVERLGIPYYCYGFYRNGGAVEASRLVSRARSAGARSCRGFVLDVEVGGQSVAGIVSAGNTLAQSADDNGIYIANHLYDQYASVVSQPWVKWTWIPTYGVNDGYAHTPPSHYCDLWQFTSVGRVPGIAGSTDCNALNGKRDLASFTSGTKPVVPVPTKKADLSLSLHVLVGDTLLGMYGNGDERKTNLGSRYTEVQNAVNHICSAKTSVLANEVQAGKWGNGDERKRALGTRYDEVQAEINAKLGVQPTGNRCYIVKSGDTLSGIAQKVGWGGNYIGLANKNGIANPNAIFAGQKIYY